MKKNKYRKNLNGEGADDSDPSERKLEFCFWGAAIMWVVSELFSSKRVLNSVTSEVLWTSVIITFVGVTLFWIIFFCLNDYKNKWLKYTLDDKLAIVLKVFFSLFVGFFWADSIICSYAVIYSNDEPVETHECPIDTFYTEKRGPTFIFYYKGESQVISMSIPEVVAEYPSLFVYEIKTRSSILNMDVIERARFRRKHE